MAPWLTITGSFLWLVMLLPVLVENDGYRYAGVLLTAVAFHHFITNRPRLMPNWVGWLCIFWGSYALIRFLSFYLASPDHPRGASEWLYVFPFFFPILGEAMWLYRDWLKDVIAVFFVIAFIALATLTNFSAIIAGEIVPPLIHNNQIHGALGCGFVLIGAFYWLMDTLIDRSAPRWRRISVFLLAPCIIVLSALNIYGAKSKGVWIALILTLPLMMISVFAYSGNERKKVRIYATLTVILLAVGAVAVKHSLWLTAGPTADAAYGLISQAWSGGYTGQLLEDAIASGQIPVSMNERLQLWSNAWEIFSAAPFFGTGNAWLALWRQTHYPDVGYTLMHNGYLEIMIRHGIFGLFVFTVMLGGFTSLVYRAWSERLISKSAFACYCVLAAYFIVTIFSNSNNRLAIGETYALLTGAFAFYCYGCLERRKWQQHLQPEAYRLQTKATKDPAVL